VLRVLARAETIGLRGNGPAGVKRKLLHLYFGPIQSPRAGDVNKESTKKTVKEVARKKRSWKKRVNISINKPTGGKLEATPSERKARERKMLRPLGG